MTTVFFLNDKFPISYPSRFMEKIKAATEVFCKIGCSLNFCKIHRKIPVPETLAQVFSSEF